MTRPPCSFTTFTPLVPSEPVPESTTTMECSFFSSAREAKNTSMGWFKVPGAYSESTSFPSLMVMYFLGGMRYTVSGSTAMLSSAWQTVISVCFPRISAIRLL